MACSITKPLAAANVILFLLLIACPSRLTINALLTPSGVQNSHLLWRRTQTVDSFRNTPNRFLNSYNEAILKCVQGGTNDESSNPTKVKNRIGSIVKTVGRLYGRYMELLEQKPLWTNSISSGIITGMGDLLSQWIEFQKKGGDTIFDVSRLASFSLAGAIFVGPYVYYWYEYLWKLGRIMEQKFNSSQQVQSWVQNIVDQTIGVVIFFPTYFYVYEIISAICSFRGEKILSIVYSLFTLFFVKILLKSFLSSNQKSSLKVPNATIATGSLRQEILAVIIMQYKVWLVANWVNFTYVPEKLRVLVSNIVAVFWSAYLSMKMA